VVFEAGDYLGLEFVVVEVMVQGEDMGIDHVAEFARKVEEGERGPSTWYGEEAGADGGGRGAG
jgi:hypothetical protein